MIENYFKIDTQPLLSRRQADNSVIWYQTMLVTDISKQICQITLRSTLKPVQNFQDQVISLVNVWYDTYDAKFGIIHIKTSYETELWIKPTGKSMSYIQTAVQELKQWIKNEPNELNEIRQKVEKLIKQ
ncbi:hypothetical protein BJ944DRAFT_261504 [Cunninghamella echinulata]|nr:hypothetical protein BJ944DRAFT_261504 [Cunninghamella echinulata]